MISSQRALATSRAFLDEATENLTFDELAWTLEEVWRGVAWALGALTNTAPTGLGPKGHVPPAGTLRAMLDTDLPPTARVVHTLEALRSQVLGATPGVADALSQTVFDAWALHDDCARRLSLFDTNVDGAPAPQALERRTALKLLLTGTGTMLAACERTVPDASRKVASSRAPRLKQKAAPPATLKATTALRAMQWPTSDPFLFCAYHLDDYPAGDANFAPRASLEGRHLGRDFEGKDNWRMYHGRTVPGFPRHPHRGFETVTVVRKGMLDHADSMGAAARYGGGDVQWLTAGGGIQHAEMFPLLRSDGPNPLELFQIWLNLPAEDKMVPPHFTMLWNEKIPKVTHKDEAGRVTLITVVAGTYDGHAPPAPPPNSWASRPESDLAIWTLRMEPGARFVLPPVQEGTERSVYLHRGQGAKVAGKALPNLHRAQVEGAGTVEIIAAAGAPCEILLLQGRPIAEPVARRGPFVMNTQSEIRQAYQDFRRTQFGGWPWPANDPVHSGARARFARHIDGREEEPG